MKTSTPEQHGFSNSIKLWVRDPEVSGFSSRVTTKYTRRNPTKLSENASVVLVQESRRVVRFDAELLCVCFEGVQTSYNITLYVAFNFFEHE